jgi:hypothetical protein
MPQIVILGWGSLLWELGPLANWVRGPWYLDGPALPLEFSRISTSRRGALTVVIDPGHGSEVPTFFIESRRGDLNDTACDLRTREGTLIRNIGVIDLQSGFARGKTPELVDRIQCWARSRDIEGVVWTDLRSNFAEITGSEFSLDNAVNYLRRLSRDAASNARRYINNVPFQIDTPLRHALDRDNWLASG